MKQGLSLRVSQHLALTPQLQQSIRLLQLSTLEMAQEVEQMLDENPFLEKTDEAALGEDMGLEVADAVVSLGEQVQDANTDALLAQQLPTERGSDSSSASTTGNEGEASESRLEAEAPLEQSWDGDGSVDVKPDDGEWGGEAPARNNNADDESASASDLARSPVSLQQHLHEQARCLRLSEAEQAALYFLIESLDDDGYLSDGLNSLAQAWLRLSGLAQEPVPRADAEPQEDPWFAEREAVEQQLLDALGHLQEMDPTGVGARDLMECLRLQIFELRNSPQARAALAICEQPMELLARRDAKRLAALCKIDEATVRQALALLARLEPKPGRRFADAERHIIVPDVIVSKAGRGFRVELNPLVMPKLRVHDIYANAMRQQRAGEGVSAQAAMNQRLQEARWFIKNIQQRFDTILRVSSAIVERQRNFFLHGELAMRPLVLREIADELGLHESTISRVTTAKFMHTPFGTFELKYFFGSGLGTETGGSASSTAVRALIKQFIGAESEQKPLSDSQLAELLREQGIECARRTVAKYREGLRIPTASLRKR